VGAVVTDGEEIVAKGHNQMFHAGPGPISSTYMAHAEMNALAQLPARPGPEYSIYSTFEPCSMCMGAIPVYRVDRVSFASVDPVWAGMHEWFDSAPWAARRETRLAHLGGEFGALGYVLHVSRLANVAPPHVIAAHQTCSVSAGAERRDGHRRRGQRAPGGQCRVGSNSRTWVSRMLFPEGSRKDVSMP
jgi:tRNA(Arg) A34 adenosine deaminase TadA